MSRLHNSLCDRNSRIWLSLSVFPVPVVLPATPAPPPPTLFGISGKGCWPWCSPATAFKSLLVGKTWPLPVTLMEADRVAAKAATVLFNSFELRLWCNASRVEFWKKSQKLMKRANLVIFDCKYQERILATVYLMKIIAWNSLGMQVKKSVSIRVCKKLILLCSFYIANN
jgi:hypothetical protein